MDLAGLADAIDRELRARATPGRAEHVRAYLRSHLEHYGTSVPAIRAVAIDVARRHPELSAGELLTLVDVLWSAPVHERRMAAVELLGRFEDRLGPGDAPLLERLLRESRTWALVDPLATGVIAPMVERHPGLGPLLDLLGRRRGLLGPPGRPARPPPGPAPGRRRLRALLPLRRRPARRPGALRPQGDRLGPPRHGEKATRPRLPVAAAQSRPGLGGDGARGGQAAVGGAADGGPG